MTSKDFKHLDCKSQVDIPRKRPPATIKPVTSPSMPRDHVTPPQVRHELSEEGSWRRTGAVVREEVAGTSTRHPVLFPYTDTYIQISLQAHNEFGYSQESVLVIRAVKGDLGAALHSVGILSLAAQATSRLWTETPRRTSRPRSCPWCRCWAGWWPCWW